LQFQFSLVHPIDELNKVVQGVWSGFLPDAAQQVTKPLYSDAGSGVLFNLGSEIYIGEQCLGKGIFSLPVTQKVQTITLLQGANLAGIRFCPAAGKTILGHRFQKISAFNREEDGFSFFFDLYDQLLMGKNEHNIDLIHTCLQPFARYAQQMPEAIIEALTSLQSISNHSIEHASNVSERQLERLFKHWLNMTPKQYQRALRVKNTLMYLRNNRQVDLADVALAFGYSDQSHMTNEFRKIAAISPKQFVAKHQSKQTMFRLI
jgi:AraC-like DNA-binding protein